MGRSRHDAPAQTDIPRIADAGHPAARFGFHPASLAAYLVCLFAAVGPTRPRPDPDTWWHLATGRLILDTGSIPSTDPFSWTAAGRGWVPHEWLSQLSFAWIYDVAGAAGLLIVGGACVGGAMALVWATMHRLGAHPWAIAIALGATTYLSTITWTIRPHVFSVLLFAGFLYLLTLHRTGVASKTIWLLVPATLLWANLHGVFLVGLGLLWMFAIGDLVRGAGARLVLVAGAASTIAIVNPNGIGAFGYPLHVARVSGDILEWAPPGLRDPYGAAFILMAVGVFVLHAWLKQRPDGVFLSAGIAFTLMGMAAVKNVWVAGIMLAPLVGSALSAVRLPTSVDTAGGERRALIAVAALMTAVALVYAGANLSQPEPALLREDGFPAAAVEELRSQPVGDVINPYYWGGYIIWAAPGYRVSIDGRNDMYGLELLTDELKLEYLRPGWEDFLARPNVTYVLWNRDGALAQAMELVEGWELIYEDRDAVLYTKVL